MGTKSLMTGEGCRFPYDNAGLHNGIYRGAGLGTSVTEAQYAAIADGTFKGMYIGDYWTVNERIYRIAAFDYYYTTGNPPCRVHHVTLVPDVSLYNHVMNSTDTTNGAYVGSQMYIRGLDQAKETVHADFGAEHVLTHRQRLSNAAANGCASAGAWYDSSVELMTEQNVYGGRVFGNMANGTALPDVGTIDHTQYPLFALCPEWIGNYQWFWLRDVVSGSRFAAVAYGAANSAAATSYAGVRPAFSIRA